MTESTNHPLSGLWKPSNLKQLWYGPDTVQKHLLETLPSSDSKAFIITGSSLANQTPLVRKIEEALGNKHHAGTFSKITQHAPVAQLDEASEIISKDKTIDTVISIGGGSPIDSAKALSYRFNEKHGRFLYHISIPTTLSAAECTFFAGYTNEDGLKVLVADPQCGVSIILYDAKFALETPTRLFLSTGLRALDHAVELHYHLTATEMPCKQMARCATSDLFTFLPKYKDDPKNEDYITQLQLAAFASLGFYGLNVKGGLGLSHVLGYALGSPYSIPHGITSCMTLGHVVKLKSEEPEAAEQLVKLLPFIGKARSGTDKRDAAQLGEEILALVDRLGLKTTLTDYKVGTEEAPVIAQRATRSDSGELHDKVLSLVKGLY